MSRVPISEKTQIGFFAFWEHGPENIYGAEYLNQLTQQRTAGNTKWPGSHRPFGASGYVTDALGPHHLLDLTSFEREAVRQRAEPLGLSGGQLHGLPLNASHETADRRHGEHLLD